MKTLFSSLLHLLVLGAALAGPATAQDLAGTWQGRLEAAPGKTITIHFVIKAAPGGGYTAVVTSPDEGAIRNVPAKSVKYADSKLTLDVPALFGGYAGTLRNGILEGEWSQEGTKLPLSLRPYKTPTLSRADIEVLRGDWVGKLTGDFGSLTIVVSLSTGADGALRSLFSVPEQGVKDWEARNVVLDDGHFSIEMPRPQARFAGVLKGDQIVGQWSQLGNLLPLTLKKGKYATPTHYLDLPAAARDQLKGRWSGTLNGLAVIVRFEPDAQGRTLGYFDSVQQNILNVPVNEAKLAGKKLTFGLVFGGIFTGELAAARMTGEWTQPGLPKPLPLVLTREIKP
jgi:hypothetical protein